LLLVVVVVVLVFVLLLVIVLVLVFVYVRMSRINPSHEYVRLLSYAGLTRRNTLFIFWWLRRRNP